MVDFNNETIVSKPPAEIVKLLIIEHRENVLMAFENYHLKEGKGIINDTSTIRARIITLFFEVEASLKRRDEALHTEMGELVISRNYEALLRAFVLLNKEFDRMGLTIVDNAKKLGGNIIERNKAHGVSI